MRDAENYVAEIYGLGTDRWTATPVTRGALGQIWKLSKNGKAFAVKEMLFGCDEEQVRAEAALRDASEKLGIASPRLLANRDGSPVTRLPPQLGGSFIKLYDWVDGGTADPLSPEVLDWVGRTLALLHRAGAGADQTPDSWYETCPRDADWGELVDRIRASGLEWADSLAALSGPAAELSRFVSPADRSTLVTSHLDVQPQNVLIGRDGPVLIDWDNAGPTSPDRELAWVVCSWAGAKHVNTDFARRIVRSYVAADGPGAIRSLHDFSMLFATHLNYIQVQAEAAVDAEKTPEQRAFGDREVRGRLAALPDLTALSRLVGELADEW
ncbi:aminoglycoside phosphotransferase family protein [Streptomyces sp. NPDC047072]|uniref:phosphotransferase enzyme family protein n=1 Tax=Streptomyces sp. NPDC047072 TaxID=3154809 RepID=UPI0033C862EC